MGMDLRIVNFRDFNSLFPAIASGEIDMIAAAITITPERQEAFDFSSPYYTSDQAVLTRSDSGFACGDTCNSADFEGYSVGVQTDTTSESWASDNLSNKTTTINSQHDLATLLLLLKTGKIGALILDSPVAQAYAKSDTAFKIAGVIKTNEQYGFVIQLGDPKQLLEKVNTALANLIDSGEYDKLIQKWFQ